jgi:hypothetical protein
LNQLAAIAVDAGNTAKAAMLLGAAALDAIGAYEFEHAWSVGRAMSSVQAAAYGSD